MQSNEPELQIYDVSTWKRVDCLPDIPQRHVAVLFQPLRGNLPWFAPKMASCRCGIVSVTRSLTKLAKNHRISEAAFSPDGSMVGCGYIQ